MVHEKVLGKRLTKQVQRLSAARLFLLLSFILAILPRKKRLTQKQRQSLAITEGQLGIRKAVIRERGEKTGTVSSHRSRGKKKRRTRKKVKHRKNGGPKRKHGGHRHKLRPGEHMVRVRGKLRRVEVAANGRWKFLKMK